jgi:Ca2+-binding EF-hand superfamily protein
MDTDGDGRITMQEFIAFQDRVFDRLDVQHKGQIDKADVDTALAQSQLRDAGGMTRGAGSRAGGGEKMLVQLSNRLAEGGAMTREMWEKRAERRFQRLDTARVGYLVPTDFHAPQRPDGSEE